jgi:PAS domain S-box-containing protein
MCTLQPKFIPEETLTDATGEVHYLQTIKKPLLSTDGKTRYVLATATDITARKRAEQERDCLFQQLEQQNQILEAKVQERTAQLRQTNEQLLIEIRERQRLTVQVEQQARTLDTILCASPDEIYMIDRAGRFLYVNRAGLQPMSALLQSQEPLQLSEIVGKTGHELGFPPELMEPHEARLESVFVTGQPLGGETSYLLHNEIRYQEYTLTPIYDLDGGVEAVVITNRDISDRKRVEEELRKSEERWQLVLKGNNDGIWDLDLKTNKVFRSTRYKEMLGYEDHELGEDNDDWAMRIHPDDFDRAMQTNQDYLERKIPYYAVEYRQQCKDGRYKWVLGRAQAVWDEAGNPVRMVGSTTDISDRKWAEEALRESEKQFRQIFQEAPIGMALADFQTNRLTQVNPAYCQLLGYSASELVSLKFDDITHPDDLPQDFHYIEQIERSKLNTYRMEKRYLRKNGEVMWANLTVTALRDQDGKPMFTLGMIEDITQRRQLQIELQHSEERFRTSIENMLDCFGIYTAIRDESGEIVDFLIEYVNAAACQNNRLTKQEQIGKRLCELLPAYRETGLFDEYCEVVETDQPLVKESLLYEDFDKDQQLSRAFDIRVVKFGDGFAAAWRDVTERKQAEDQIKASLLEKETLLQEIHHRVKNNLQVISSLLRLQSRQIRDQQALELFKDSQNRVQAMALIHEKLYQSSNLAFIDFQEYITSLVGNLCRSYDIYRQAITFKVNVNQVSLAIDTAIPCGLIINELVANSLKYAFPDNRGGEISISLESMHSGQFILTISDNGVGLPENLDFRNTSSLGLQLVCRLSKQLEGSIELNRNQGTEFKIAFANAKS